MSQGPYYHGVSTNLRRFMDIIDSGGLMSQRYRRDSDRRGLISHPNTTGGDDLISLATYPSASYDTYISPGIAFVIDNVPIVTGIRGALEGEVYARDFIPISLFAGVYVNEDLANANLGDINLCALTYGSASIDDKVKYALSELQMESPDTISTVMEEYHTSEMQLQQEINDLMVAQRRAPRSEKLGYRDRIIAKMEELDNLTRALDKACTMAFLEILAQKLNISVTDVANMTVGHFIELYISTV